MSRMVMPVVMAVGLMGWALSGTARAQAPVTAAAGALAQQTPARTFEELERLSLTGRNVTVTDKSGREVEGEVLSLSATSLVVLVRGARRSLGLGDVRLIQRREHDSVVNGALIGAAVVAIPMLLMAADGGCYEGRCVPGALLFTGIGAGIGVMVDAGVRGDKRTIYLAPEPRGSAASLAVSPVVSHDRLGVRLALRF